MYSESRIGKILNWLYHLCRLKVYNHEWNGILPKKKKRTFVHRSSTYSPRYHYNFSNRTKSTSPAKLVCRRNLSKLCERVLMNLIVFLVFLAFINNNNFRKIFDEKDFYHTLLLHWQTSTFPFIFFLGFLCVVLLN